MQPSNPTPRQSRLLAFIFASCLLLALSVLQTPRLFTCAAESPAGPGHDRLNEPALHAHVDVEVAQIEDDNLNTEGSDGYAPDFAYLDRSLIGRQDPEVFPLTNNNKSGRDIIPGNIQHFVFHLGQSSVRRSDDNSQNALDARGSENDSENTVQIEEIDIESEVGDDDNAERLDLRKRQGASVWVTANTCNQPLPSGNGSATLKEHPQLIMYVSTSPQNQKPGPNSPGNKVVFDSGYAAERVEVSGDVYIGIEAPNIDKDWFGSWHFEIAASIDGPFHNYSSDSPFLFMVDTDSESALFITPPLDPSNDTAAVDKWKAQNPFKMYAFPVNDRALITGMEHSFCALKQQFNSNSTTNFTISSNITTRFLDKSPKSQFHVKGLNAATMYNGFLVVEENQQTASLSGIGIVKGGGQVFKPFNWTTKADDSCQVLFDLDFCDSVAYAVPSSKNFKLNDTALKNLYDSQARSYYQNFSRSLAQVACDTVPEAQYSLARTCKDCEQDYKNWLCSVLIPRCEDWSADDPWLQPRNINEPFANGSLTFDGNVTKEFNDTYRDRFGFSKSRNPLIDTMITPRQPWKEIKPCEDLCFDIVRSCPAQLKFACPNFPAIELTYGRRDPNNVSLTCNFPGALVQLNVQGAARTLSASVGSAMLAALFAAMFVWV